MLRNENQTYADVVGFIKQALQEAGITGFSIVQADQALNLSIDTAVVLVDRFHSRRYGWQGQHYVKEDSLKRIVDYFQDIHFQIRALKRRKGVQDATVATSNDVIQSIITWFQSQNGIKSLKSLGYNLLRITDIKEESFIDKTNKYEKSPEFTLVLTLYQSAETEQDVINSIDGNFIEVG